MYVNPLLSIVGDTLDWDSLRKSLTSVTTDQKIEDTLHKDYKVDIFPHILIVHFHLLHKSEVYSNLSMADLMRQVLLSRCLMLQGAK